MPPQASFATALLIACTSVGRWHVQHYHNWQQILYIIMYVCMYVCMVITYSRVWINRVRLPILLVVSWTGKKKFPCPRACLRIWSREMGSAVPSRVSLLISILRLNVVLTYGIPPEFRGGVHLWHRHTPSGQSRVYRVTQLRTDGVHCRESAGTGPVNERSELLIDGDGKKSTQKTPEKKRAPSPSSLEILPASDSELRSHVFLGERTFLFQKQKARGVELTSRGL